ncbi:MAG: PAS domain S-box protein [bacterium]
MTHQLDYIFFFYGLGFILLGGICFTAEKKKNALPWTWLGLFGLIHGLNEWLDMLALDMFDSPLFKAVRICVMALSFICLVEFGRLGMISVHGKGPGRWVTLALFLVGCTGWLYNWVGLNVFFRYSIGFVGGIWSAYAILSARRRSDNPVERRNMLALGLLLLTYAVSTALFVPKAPFLPASLINYDSFLHRFGFPVQLLRGMLAVASAYCVWRVLEQRTLRTVRIVFVCSLLAILTGGWFYTNRQGKNEHSEWMDSLQTTCTISAASISSDLVNGIDSIEDLQNPRYIFLKKRLMEMQRTSPEFRYIYLMVVRDGRIIFSADSVSPTAEDYSPPGDEYTDAPAELRALCRGKGRSATAEYEDQWGKWDSAFETVTDDATGKPVAILGMDYPQEKVYSAVNSIRLNAIMATLLLAVVAILSFYFRERREYFIRSISEASKTLQQKEEDLSLTLRSIGDAVISTDAQGRVIRMNPTAEELTGWVHSEAVGHPISEVLNIVNALTGEPAPIPVNEVLSTGEVHHLEDHTMLISLDGSRRQITDSAAPIRDVTGTIVGMVLVFSDMTEQYRITEQLQKNEAQLRAIMDNAGATVYMKDTEGRYIHVNRVFEGLFDVKNAAIQGKTDYDLFPPEIAEAFVKNDRFILQVGLLQEIEEKVIANGRTYTYLSAKFPLKTANGEIYAICGISTDITERKQAEEALQKSEEKYRNLIETTRTGFLVLDGQGLVVDANAEYVRLSGHCELDEILGRCPIEWTAAHSLEKNSAALDQCFREGFIQGLEIDYTRVDGQITPIEINATVVGAGADLRIISLCRDITERKQAEKALSEALDRLQQISNQVPGLVYQFRLRPDGSSCMPFASNAIKEIFRVSPDEVREDASKVFASFHPDDYASVVASIQVSAQDLTLWHPEFRVKYDDGTVRWLYGNAVPQMEEDGSVLWHGFVTDITERKQVEKALLESEEKHRHLIENSHDIIYTLTAEGIFNFVSPAWTALLGYPANQVEGKPFQQFIHPDDLAECMVFLQAVIETGERHKGVEYRVQHSDGSWRWHTTSAVPLSNEFGKIIGFEGTAHDITESKQAEEALRESEETFRSYIENSFDIIFTLDITGKFLFLSPAWERHFGYPVNDFIGKMFVPFVHPDDCKHLGEYLMRVFETGEAETSLPYRVKHSNGDWHWFIANGTLYTNKNGELQFIGVGRDITDQKHGDELLQREKDNLSAIFSSSPVGMLLLDEETMIVNANDVVSGMISRSLERIVGQRGGGGLGCVHSFENEKGCGFSSVCGQCSLRQGVTQVLKTGTSIRGAEIQVSLINNGQEQSPWLRVNAEPVTINGSKHVIIAFDDITERKQAEEELIQAKAMADSLNHQLEDAMLSANTNAVEAILAKDLLEDNADELKHQATHDSLTGLPNRHYFEEHLSELIKSGSRKKSGSMAVIFLDLDKFKLVNDTLGHKVGDLLLIEVSNRLQSCLRSEDILARMGGDEFTIILTNCPRKSSVDKLATRMIDMISRPYDIQGHRFMIGVSIGIASYPSDGIDSVNLLKHADAAMYKAKQAGRGLFSWFTGEVDVDNQQRAVLENDIRLALENNQFEMHYQPIVSLEDNTLLSAEALLRWKHPEKGMISPSLLIPLAEEMGLIGKIGDYALQTACAQTVAWRDEGIHLSRINVNVSTKQINNDKWLESVIATLSKTGLDPKLLNLEVTETDFTTDDKEMMETLNKVRELGISMAIDDFGMGRSSLSRLKDFPVIHLKIDGSFIRDIEHNKDDNALVRSIVDMAHNQGIKVTAEWVETKTQMEILHSSGCDFIQGYYISPALSTQDFKNFAHEWMHNHPETKTA